MLLVLLLRLKNKGMCYFLMFLFFFLAAFRGENVGTDTKNYLSYSNLMRNADNANFSDFNILDLGSRVEIVNNFICKLILRLELPSRFILIFYAAIMLIFLYLACKRFKVNFAYTLVFYILFGYYFISFNIARQLCAASVVLYSLSFLGEYGKNRIPFFFWLAIAVGIHSLSIICLTFFIIPFLPKLKVKFAYLLLAISLFLIFVHIDFISQLFNIISSSHIDSYMNKFGEMREFNTIGLMSCCIEILCFYYFLFKTKQSIGSDYLNIYDYIFLLSILFYTAFFNYNGIVSRMRFTLCLFICPYLASYFAQKPLNSNPKDAVVFYALFFLNLIKRYQYSLGDDVAYYLNF